MSTDAITPDAKDEDNAGRQGQTMSRDEKDKDEDEAYQGLGTKRHASSDVPGPEKKPKTAEDA